MLFRYFIFCPHGIAGSAIGNSQFFNRIEEVVATAYVVANAVDALVKSGQWDTAKGLAFNNNTCIIIQSLNQHQPTLFSIT